MAISKNPAALVKDTVGICDDLRIISARAADVVARYFDTDLSSDVSGLATDDTIVPGTPIDKANMLSAITLLQQLANFTGGQAVATAQYRVTINKIAALKE